MPNELWLKKWCDSILQIAINTRPLLCPIEAASSCWQVIPQNNHLSFIISMRGLIVKSSCLQRPTGAIWGQLHGHWWLLGTITWPWMHSKWDRAFLWGCVRCWGLNPGPSAKKARAVHWATSSAPRQNIENEIWTTFPDYTCPELQLYRSTVLKPLPPAEG